MQKGLATCLTTLRYIREGAALLTFASSVDPGSNPLHTTRSHSINTTQVARSIMSDPSMTRLGARKQVSPPPPPPGPF